MNKKRVSKYSIIFLAILLTGFSNNPRQEKSVLEWFKSMRKDNVYFDSTSFVNSFPLNLSDFSVKDVAYTHGRKKKVHIANQDSSKLVFENGKFYCYSNPATKWSCDYTTSIHLPDVALVTLTICTNTKETFYHNIRWFNEEYIATDHYGIDFTNSNKPYYKGRRLFKILHSGK